MSKKKRKSPLPVVRVKTDDMRRLLIRLPEDLAVWLDTQAAEAGLSRDAFMRQMVKGMQAGFELAAVEGTKESTLFRKLESNILAATERAVDEAMRTVMTNTGAVARVVGRAERPPFTPQKRG